MKPDAFSDRLRRFFCDEAPWGLCILSQNVARVQIGEMEATFDFSYVMYVKHLWKGSSYFDEQKIKRPLRDCLGIKLKF